MNRIFSVSKLIILVTYTTCVTIGHGIPLRGIVQVGDEKPRHTRSQLYRRLCPTGINMQSCFFSQLSMFIRMQDSLVDPVNLRNIGKRNGIQDGRSKPFDLARNLDHINTLDIGTAERDYLKRIGAFDDIGSDIYNSQQEQPSLQDFSDYYDSSNALPDLQQELDNLLKHSTHNTELWDYKDPKQNWDISYEHKRDNQLFSPPEKRQIICPDDMSRMDCYDNALAFYFRLLRTVNDH